MAKQTLDINVQGMRIEVDAASPEEAFQLFTEKWASLAINVANEDVVYDTGVLTLAKQSV
jgi:hypothetical protein